jgi:pimeloyl-ACP methyl ester carboxylesterase
VPHADPRLKAIRNCRLVTVPNAGHWVHHDQLELFLKETTAFLAA